jgi:hypothetical protein
MMEQWNNGFWENGKVGLGSDIGHGLFVGWVEHPDIFCWVSFHNPTYLLYIFVIVAKPNKMAVDRTIPEKCVTGKFLLDREVKKVS